MYQQGIAWASVTNKSVIVSVGKFSEAYTLERSVVQNIQWWTMPSDSEINRGFPYVSIGHSNIS